MTPARYLDTMRNCLKEMGHLGSFGGKMKKHTWVYFFVMAALGLSSCSLSINRALDWSPQLLDNQAIEKKLSQFNLPKRPGLVATNVRYFGSFSDSANNFYAYGFVRWQYLDPLQVTTFGASVLKTGFFVRYSPGSAGNPWTYFDFSNSFIFGKFSESSIVKKVIIENGYAYLIGDGVTETSILPGAVDSDLFVLKFNLQTRLVDPNFGQLFSPLGPIRNGLVRINVGTALDTLGNPVPSIDFVGDAFQRNLNRITIGYRSDAGLASGAAYNSGIINFFTDSFGGVNTSFGVNGFLPIVPQILSGGNFQTLTPFDPSGGVPQQVYVTNQSVVTEGTDWVLRLEKQNQSGGADPNFGGPVAGVAEVLRYPVTIGGQPVSQPAANLFSASTSRTILTTFLPTQVSNDIQRFYLLTPRGLPAGSFGPPVTTGLRQGYIEIPQSTQGPPVYIASAAQANDGVGGFVLLGVNFSGGEFVASVAPDGSSISDWAQVDEDSSWANYRVSQIARSVSAAVVFGDSIPFNTQQYDLSITANVLPLLGANSTASPI